jgi:hypothetical protein
LTARPEAMVDAQRIYGPGILRLDFVVLINALQQYHNAAGTIHAF